MKAGGNEVYDWRPEWIEDALVIRCARCFDQPGSTHKDGSGKCEACNGAAWIVLMTRADSGEGEKG